MPATRKRGPALSYYSPPTTRATTTKRTKFSRFDMSTVASTSNAFQMLDNNVNLSDCESMISLESRRRRIPSKSIEKAANVQKSSYKPPPLNIVGVEYAFVNEMLKRHKQNPDDYSLSLAPFGIRVFSANIDRYKVLKNELEKIKCQFFTYQLREEQTKKFVLHGLYHMPENELETYLADCNIKPIKIKKMNIFNKKYSDHCLYLLYFLKSDQVKLSQLREISKVNSVKVGWKHYESNQSGPMQCSNCMSYGHGGANCHLDPKCMRCAGLHKTKDCPCLIDPLTNQLREKIPDDQVKCALCQQNHTANFSRCEKRIEFMERQQRYRGRTQRHHQTHGSFVNSPQLNDFNFPRLDPRARAAHSTQNAQWVPNGNGNSNSNELFTSAELMPIFDELMSALGQARSKMEQISVLGRIAIKYCGR